ncbi:molecular chaperone [Stenotrophomonas sp. LARHCG68]
MRCASIFSLTVVGLLSYGALFGIAHAGIQVGGTRVIFDASQDKRETSLPVRNKGETPYVIQAFADDGVHGGARTPFVVTPGVFRLDGGKEQLVQVRNVATQVRPPEDRESVYWLNIKEIPPKARAEGDNNTLQIAVLTRIKLFYRPAGLVGSATDAPAQLRWSVVPGPMGRGRALKVSNPTPYYVTFSRIDISGSSGEAINADMVAPRSELVIPVRSAPSSGPIQFTYTTINDHGAVTPAISVSAQSSPSAVTAATTSRELPAQ